MLLPVVGQRIWRLAIFALLPLALSLAVVRGLNISIFLTLLVVPAGCALLEGARKKKRCAG